MKDLNFKSYQEYLDYISTNPEEIDHFLSKFTINYTYFFRNYQVFEKVEELIKSYIKGQKRTIRIWSAPCATGEEPYSIAMMFDKLAKNISNFPEFEITASDIDKTAIALARTGNFGEYSVHDTPKYYLNTYFKKTDTQIGPKYLISKAIQEKVEFFEEDIINQHNRKTKYDIIFCRNFFIYINKESQKKLLTILDNHLVSGGILILGKTEMISNFGNNFISVDVFNHIYAKNHSLWLENKSNIVINPRARKKKIQPSNKKKPSIPKKKEKPQLIEVKLGEVIKKEKIVPTESLIEKLEQREIEVNRRLNIVEVREGRLEQRSIEVEEKEGQLNQWEIKLNQREILLNVRESQIKKQEENLEFYNKQIGQREQSLNQITGAENVSTGQAPDQIIHPNMKGELNLPIGYYAIINSHNTEQSSTKFSINGLSSGIALLLRDINSKVYAMSNILLPNSAKADGDSHLKHPHKFVDTSVKNLLDNMLYHGAHKKSIEAIVIGGSKNIYDQDLIFQENIDAIKNELFRHNIKIEKEFLGGIVDQSLIFDTTNNSLYIKKKWEEFFRIIIV